MLGQRVEVYEAAKARHPERWSGATRNWQPIAIVYLNPDQRVKKTKGGATDRTKKQLKCKHSGEVVGLRSRCQRFEFLFNSGNVGINRLVEQTDLTSIEQLAAAPELPALERGQLVGEFVDLGLAVQDVAVFGRDGRSVLLALLGDL